VQRNLDPRGFAIVTSRRPASYENDAASTVLDGREGDWTRLALMRMDASYREAVLRAHPERIEQPAEPAVLDREARTMRG
jgi:hypothetical protein